MPEVEGYKYVYPRYEFRGGKRYRRLCRKQAQKMIEMLMIIIHIFPTGNIYRKSVSCRR
jgi:hypothetical protein